MKEVDAMTVCVAVGRYEQRHSLNLEALAPVARPAEAACLELRIWTVIQCLH